MTGRRSVAFSAAVAVVCLAGAARAGTITGTVYVDVDADGLFSVGDVPVEGVRVAFDASAFAVTDATGAFTLAAPSGAGIVWVRTTDEYEPGPAWRAIDQQPADPVDIALVPTRLAHPSTFVVASDSHLGRDEYASAMANDEFDGGDLAVGLTQATDLEPPPHFFVIVGDIVQSNNAGGYDQVLQVSRDLGIPFVPVPGNHDWFDGGDAYRSLLGPPMYSFDSGGVRFVVLNDNGSVAAYTTFLTGDLADAGDRPVVAFMHRPPSDAILDSLELAGVDYLLTGHWHSNEAFSYGNMIELSTEPIIRGGMDTTPAGYRVATLVDGALQFFHGSVVERPHLEIAYPREGACVVGNAVTVVATAMASATPPELRASADGNAEVEMAQAGGWSATARVTLDASASHEVTVRFGDTTRTVPFFTCDPERPAELADWPQPQGTARHEGATAIAIPPPLRVRWARAVGGHVHGGSPVVASGRVFVTTTDFGGPRGGAVVALDATTGETLWRFDTAGDIRSAPATSDDIVVVAALDGTVYGLDAASGQPLWTTAVTEGLDQNVAAFKAAPAIANGSVYIGTQARMVALDLTSGAPVWDDVPTPDHATMTSYAAAGATDAVVVGAFGRGRGGVVGWDAMTGERIWTLSRADSEGVHAAPVISDGALYVANAKGEVMAYDADTGESRWKTPLHDGSTNWDYGLIATPAIADGLLYVPGQYDYLFAVRADSGEVAWKLRAEPSVLHVSHARSTTSAFPSSPVVTGDLLWVGGADGALRAVGKDNGAERWRITLDSPITAGPAVAASHLYVATFGGVVYALHGPTDDDYTSVDDRGGGCALGGHSRPGGAAPIVILALLAWRRRR